MTENRKCRKCNGTGWLNWSRIDGGRCWSCQNLADTGQPLSTLTDEEAAARWHAICDQRRAERRARRAAA